MIKKIGSIACGDGKIDGVHRCRITSGGGEKLGTVHTRMDLLENGHRINNIFVMELYGEVDDGN